MWVRGLKLAYLYDPVIFTGSHPVWVRGLKRIATEYELKPHCVAPRVGAWIETISLNLKRHGSGMSHPVWVRGLKHNIYQNRTL